MLFSIVVHQMTLFFAILLIGFAAGKLGVIRRAYLPDFAQLVSKLLLPVMLFYMTYAGTTRQMLRENAAMIGLAALFYLMICTVMYLLSKLLHPVGDRAKVFQFAFIFGNTGFVGAPLLAALFPKDGVLYLALFSIVDQLLFWTYGVWLATASDKKAKISLRSFVNPNLIATGLALLLILLGVKLPAIVDDVLTTIKNAVGAMSMLYLGALFCFSDWHTAFKSRELYFGIAVKMILLPVVCGRLLQSTGLPADMVSAMVILMALPTMTVVPMIAKLHGNEGAYAAGTTVATLAASILTIPLVTYLVL